MEGVACADLSVEFLVGSSSPVAAENLVLG